MEIPPGKGYLYIDQSIVDLRREHRTEQEAREFVEARMKKQLSGIGQFSGFYRIGPVLMCKKGAGLRNLDLQIAAADARHWWETGMVPLRATPSSQSSREGSKHDASSNQNDTKPVRRKRHIVWGVVGLIFAFGAFRGVLEKADDITSPFAIGGLFAVCMFLFLGISAIIGKKVPPEVH